MTTPIEWSRLDKLDLPQETGYFICLVRRVTLKESLRKCCKDSLTPETDKSSQFVWSHSRLVKISASDENRVFVKTLINVDSKSSSWASSRCEISSAMRCRIHQSRVHTILLYGCVSWHASDLYKVVEFDKLRMRRSLLWTEFIKINYCHVVSSVVTQATSTMLPEFLKLATNTTFLVSQQILIRFFFNKMPLPLFIK